MDCSFLNSQIAADLIGVIGTLTGAALGFGSAIYLKKKGQKEQIRNYISSLIAEITSLKERYDFILGVHILSNNDLALLNIRIFRPFNNYFVVFDNNIAVLGCIKEDLPREIVRVYMAMKATFETVVEGGERLDKIPIGTQEYINFAQGYLIDIKRNHNILVPIVEKLIKELNTYLVELSK